MLKLCVGNWPSFLSSDGGGFNPGQQAAPEGGEEEEMLVFK